MKNCFLLIILMTFTYSPLKAQFNLVPNPSFETYTSCPTSLGKIKFATPWDLAIWNNSSDYFNSCNPSGWSSVPSNLFGFQYPRTGNAYAGIATYSWNVVPNNAREYIQVELLDSLEAGIEYCLNFFVSPGDSCRRVSNDFGAYFSTSLIVDSCGGLPYCNLPFQPQIENPSTNDLNDRNSWIEISGSFVASGGEKFLILGNFKDTSTSTATLTGWSNIQSLAHTYYYIDDVLLAPCDSITGLTDEVLENSLHIFPTIASGEINIRLDNLLLNSVSIYNIIGESVLNIKNLKTSEATVNISKLNIGMYILKVSSSQKTLTSYFIKN